MLQLDENCDFTTVTLQGHTPVKFDMRPYKVARLSSINRPYDAINAFLERERPEIRLGIFNILLECKDLLVTTEDKLYLDTRLMDCIRRLYQLVSYERLSSFVIVSSGIMMPKEIKQSYDDVDVGFSHDKTYIQSSYLELITFLVACRLVIPVLSEYMSQIESQATTAGREWDAYILLKDCYLAELPAVLKLVNYVKASFNSSVDTAGATLAGIGVAQVPEFIAAYVIVRKLPTFDLYSREKNNVISAIHSYVNQNLSRLTQKLMPDARERRVDSSSDDRDQAYIEVLRSKQSVNYGTLEQNISYLTTKTIAQICTDFDPTFNPDIAYAVEAVSHGLGQAEFNVHNHLLTQWVTDKHLSTFQPDVIEREFAVRIKIVAQALLHHWGLHNLALLSTGVRVDNKAYETLGDRFDRVTSDQMAILDKLYPHHIPTGSRNAAQRNRESNYGYCDLIEMAKLLTNYSYAVRTPQFLTVNDVNVDRYGHLSTPPSVTTELINLFVKLDDLME